MDAGVWTSGAGGEEGRGDLGLRGGEGGGVESHGPSAGRGDGTPWGDVFVLSCRWNLSVGSISGFAGGSQGREQVTAASCGANQPRVQGRFHLPLSEGVSPAGRLSWTPFSRRGPGNPAGSFLLPIPGVLPARKQVEGHWECPGGLGPSCEGGWGASPAACLQEDGFRGASSRGSSHVGRVANPGAPHGRPRVGADGGGSPQGSRKALVGGRP